MSENPTTRGDAVSSAVKTLSNGYEALGARDDDALMACLSEDVELRTLTGSYHGHDGIRKWIADMDDGWSGWGLTIDAIEDIGGAVLVKATLAGRSSLNQLAMSHEFWVAWQLRNGQAVVGSHYETREQALAGLGLAG